MMFAEHEWTISDEDESWMWCGADPRTANDPDGNFTEYLIHEFGHWVVALDLGVQVYGLGLYGLSHDNSDRVQVGGGGGVGLDYGNLGTEHQRDCKTVIINTAGVVAELLSYCADYVFDDPLRYLNAKASFDNDFATAKKHLAKIAITENDSLRFSEALRKAMEKSAGVIKPLLPRLREQARRLEQLVSERRLSKMEIMWSGKHAALLTGKPSDDFEIRYDKPL